LRILFLGDIVGRTGRDAVIAALPGLRKTLALDLVVVNGENASHGFGLAPAMAADLFAAGADVITLGNHAWDRKELLGYIETQPRLLRPLNFPPGTPGHGSVVVDLADGRRALVLQVMGRLFMEPNDDPFRVTAELLGKHRLGVTVDAVVADFHGEATSEKMAYGHSFDGRASLIVGTHTHCPTATTTASSAWTRARPRRGSGSACRANVWRRPRARRLCAACSWRRIHAPESPPACLRCGRAGGCFRLCLWGRSRLRRALFFLGRKNQRTFTS
jgi:metallophosphoesterase (TIGR00282 family)